MTPITTIEQVFDWAQANGFKLEGMAGGEGYVCPYGKCMVVIAQVKRHIRVVMASPRGEYLTLARFMPSKRNPQAYLNAQGMLEGVGLSSSFVQRFAPQIIAGKVGMPPWFPAEYAAEVRASLGLEAYRPGQVWKDKRRSPTSVFTVLEVYETQRTVRVRGVSCDTEGLVSGDHDLDARSMAKMFPFPLFVPPARRDPDEDK